MRNLSLRHVRRGCLGLGLAEHALMAVDSLTETLYVASAASLNAFDRQFDSTSVNLCDVAAGDEIVGVEYLSDELLLCVATAGGCVVTCDVGTAEIVAMVDEGISVASWSPDLQLLAIVSGSGVLMLLSRQFDVLEQTSLESCGVGADQVVAVGWGKKETQFHGSAGKAAAAEAPPADNTTACWDDGRAHVSWRGDGQYFVVGSVHEPAGQFCTCVAQTNEGVRKLRVFSRDGSHCSTCEQVAGLAPPLSWRPSGNLIAAVVHPRESSARVVFFERNGLQHGDFPLRLEDSSSIVVAIFWNSDSSVLAVHTSSSEAVGDCVQFYSCSNYHWSLKYVHCFACAALAVGWDAEQSLLLHAILADDRYAALEFTWRTSTSAAAVAAVVDGPLVRLTDFSRAVVPPPMCHQTLETAAFVIALAWSGGGRLALLFHDSTALLYGRLDDGALHQEGEPIRLSERGSPPYHFGFSGADHLVFVLLTNDRQWTICFRSLTADTCVHRVQLDFAPTLVLPRLLDQSVLVESEQAYWFSCSAASQLATPWPTVHGQLKLRVGCVDAALVEYEGETRVVALSGAHQLCVDERQVATNATSFVVRAPFLLVTTLAHELHCLPLNALADAEALLRVDGRRLERGARLLCATAPATRVVLQLPRGNLETIDPRPLVFAVLRDLLCRRHYKDALQMMKKHRINMNVAFDINPAVFLKHVDEFVADVADANLLNLFLTELGADNVARRMYGQWLGDSPPDDYDGGKVETVCVAIRDAIDRLSNGPKGGLLTVVLTTFLKRSPPQLDAALRRIDECRESQAEAADAALRHVLCYVDAEQLYRAALATYNFDLVLMVAERSQKDPKEYLPYLNKLNVMQPEYMKFSIENDLENYDRALTHLAKCTHDNSLAECVSFVKQHTLYRQAIRLFHGTPACQTLMEAYAQWLVSRRNWKEAAVWLESCGRVDDAIESNLKALDWRAAHRLARSSGKSAEEVAVVVQSAAKRLEEANELSDCAQLYANHLGQPETAARLWAEAGRYARASHLLADRRALADVVKPIVTRHARSLLERVRSLADQLSEQAQRLRQVREAKRHRLMHCLQSGEADVAESEVYSEASATTTRSAASSTASQSSKSERRRRAHKQKLSLKQGGRFEDLALLHSIKQAVAAVDAMQDEAVELLPSLLEMGEAQDAADVQCRLSDLLAACERLTAELWPAEWTASALPAPVDQIVDFFNNCGTMQAFENQAFIHEPQMVAPVIRKAVHWKLDYLSDQG